MDFNDFAEYTEVADTREESQILINLAYILVVLVVVATAITFVLFSAREYLIAKKKKPRSPTSARIRQDGWVTDDVHEAAKECATTEPVPPINGYEKALLSPNDFLFVSPHIREVLPSTAVPPGTRIPPSTIAPPSTGAHLDMVTARSKRFPSMDVVDLDLDTLETARVFSTNSTYHTRFKHFNNCGGESNASDFITDEKTLLGPRAPFTIEVTNRSQRVKRDEKSPASACDPFASSKNLGSSNYTILQISALKVLPLVGSIFNHNMSQRQTLLFSQIAQYSSQIPGTVYDSAWTAEKAITKVRASLDAPEMILDLALKRIHLLTLFSIGASHRTLDNPNYFLPAFNDLMEAMLDAGMLFEILEGVGSFSQRTLMELVVAYCWSHWDFKPQRAPDIMAQFHIWNLPAPLVQPHAAIFRYLCNFALGLCTVKRIERRDLVEAEFRVHTLMREITRCASCHDYIGILPMLSQAIGLTDIFRVKALFYLVLQILLANHSTCCMSDYLLEPLLDLKVLMQHGLWHCNHIKVTEKAYEIYIFLKSHNPALVTSWWDEIDGGRINVMPGQMTEHPPLMPFAQGSETPILSSDHSKIQIPVNSSTLRLRPATPGSWYMDLCLRQRPSDTRPNHPPERFPKYR